MTHFSTCLLLASFLILATVCHLTLASQNTAFKSTLYANTYNIESKPNNDSMLTFSPKTPGSFIDSFEVNYQVYQILATCFNTRTDQVNIAMSGYQMLTVQVHPRIQILKHETIPKNPELMHYSHSLNGIIMLTMTESDGNQINLYRNGTLTPLFNFNETWGVFFGPDTYDYQHDLLYFVVTDVNTNSNLLVQADIQAGKIANTFAIPNKDQGKAIPDGLQYSSKTGNIFAIFQDELVEIDSKTGKFTTVAKIQKAILESYSAVFDELTGIYYYEAIADSKFYWIGIDVQTGKIVQEERVYNAFKNVHWFKTN